MLIVGYYESHKVFVIQNSWGEGWGYDGYCFMPYDYIANSDFNIGQNFATRSLTDYDCTPVEGGFGALPAFDEEEPEEPAEVKILEESNDKCNEDEEEDFDHYEFFSALAEAKKVFDKCNLDESGKMDMAELGTALMMNGQYITDDIIEGIMEEYDEDGSGKLGFVEYLQILGVVVPEELFPNEDEEEKEEHDDEEEEEEHDVDDEEEEEEEEEEECDCDCDDDDDECDDNNEEKYE